MSLKLIEDLRQSTQCEGAGGKFLREISLDEPIRYALHDPVEAWLYKLLCLDATNSLPNLCGSPDPDHCHL